MPLSETLETRDIEHIWHPCSQMKDHETARLLTIVSAEGCYLKTDDGSLLFDAISSWWCKSLGHGHPRLKRALKKQLEQFEHVIFAGTTYDAIVELSEKNDAITTKRKQSVFCQ
ncbi:MAG: aminotransferase class III-fold pyridoxal phosphate-dependent enzyme [Gammaproteobacteria bacterium]|nr:aminotransferase class III-fold pyridoxal phosphate-dependent enzyme [Gammaproteobacteria bacterium]